MNGLNCPKCLSLDIQKADVTGYALEKYFCVKCKFEFYVGIKEDQAEE